MNKEEMRQRLLNRTQQSAINTEKKGLGKKTLLDFSAVGDRPIELYTMKGGVGIKNVIDHLPYQITQDWVAQMREPSGAPNGLEPGLLDYKLEYCVHKKQGATEETVLCLKNTFFRKCPQCEARQLLFDIDENKRTVNQEKMLDFLRPSWRNTYNIYDYDEPSKDIQLWDDVSYKLYEEFLKLRIQTDHEGLKAFSDYELGQTVVFEGKAKTIGTGRPFFEAAQFSFEQRDQPWAWETYEEVFPLDLMLQIPEYDEVYEIFKSLEAPPESQDDQPPGGRPDRDRTRTRQVDSQPAQDACIAGHTLGIDHQAFDDCEKCSETEFQECASLSSTPTGRGHADNQPGESAGGPGDEPWNKPGGGDQPGQDPPAPSGRTRERTRGGNASADSQPTGSEASQTTRTRTRGTTTPPVTDADQPNTGARRTRTRTRG